MTFQRTVALAAAGIAAAALIGAFVGILVSGAGGFLRADSAGRIVTKEFVLLDEHNKPAARLQHLNGKTVLQFYAEDSSLALEVGVDHLNPARFIRFYGKKGEILAALNTVSSGDSTLFLRDQRWGTRLMLGALRSDDMDLSKPTRDWGLVFRKPGSLQPIFNLFVNAPDDADKATAALGLIRSNGEEWSVH